MSKFGLSSNDYTMIAFISKKMNDKVDELCEEIFNYIGLTGPSVRIKQNNIKIFILLYFTFWQAVVVVRFSKLNIIEVLACYWEKYNSIGSNFGPIYRNRLSKADKDYSNYKEILKNLKNEIMGALDIETQSRKKINVFVINNAKEIFKILESKENEIINEQTIYFSCLQKD